MTKIPATTQPWADVPPYGKVFLRKYFAFHAIKIYRCVQEAASEAVPHMLEYYHFIAPLSDSALMDRLHLMGYPKNLFIAGVNEGGFANKVFVAVTKYCGEMLNPTVRKLMEGGRVEELKVLMRSFGVCFGTLHSAGLICGDTAPDQFVVDDSLVVRRIDIHQTRVRMDIVEGHPVFGGTHEPYFEDFRLTVKGFEAGVQRELMLPMHHAKFLEKEICSGNEATQHFREGYLSAGGSADDLSSAEAAFA